VSRIKNLLRESQENALTMSKKDIEEEFKLKISLKNGTPEEIKKLSSY
jgi:hypothetical protein